MLILPGQAVRESRVTNSPGCERWCVPETAHNIENRDTARYRLTRDNRRRPKRDGRRRSVLIVPLVGGEPLSEGATVGKGDTGRNDVLDGKKGET